MSGECGGCGKISQLNSDNFFYNAFRYDMRSSVVMMEDNVVPIR